MKSITIQSDGAEVRFRADTFARFNVETDEGLIEVVVGVSGPGAEALV